MALNLSTVSLTGTVRVDGTPVGSALIDFASAAGSAYLFTSAGGGGQFSGRIFTGTYDVALLNSPVFSVQRLPLRRSWLASTAPLVADLTSRRVTVEVTHNGQVPPDASGRAGLRGSLTLTEGTASAQVTSLVNLPLQGPLSAALTLYDGSWTVAYTRSFDPNYTELPSGTVALGTIPVSASNMSRILDLRSVRVFGETTLGHQPFPAAMAGRNRGALLFSTIGQGPGTGTAIIPGAGRATYSLWLFPGVYSVRYGCGSNDCDTTFGPPGESLLTGIEVR
jgi:hypothetical protein